MGRTPIDAEEIRQGLTLPLPEVPSKYLYDDLGSRLFEEITTLEEYYQTRTEEAILAAEAPRIIDRVRPTELVELGSGAGRKIRILLDEMGRRDLLDRCTLLEINEMFLLESMGRLKDQYPDLDVRGIPGDFEHDLVRLGPGGGRLVLFLAGTIGNLVPEEAARFVGRMAKQLEPGDGFLVGFDLVKDVNRIEAAYNDARGVTAAFNRNILRALNHRFRADFVPEDFDHVAFYDVERAWIEMRLRARKAMRVHVAAADLDLAFAPGDEIRTEVSCKYTRNRVAGLAGAGGLVLDGWYTDPEDLFAVALLRKLP